MSVTIRTGTRATVTLSTRVSTAPASTAGTPIGLLLVLTKAA